MHCNIYHADVELPMDKTNFIVEGTYAQWRGWLTLLMCRNLSQIAGLRDIWLDLQILCMICARVLDAA
jgi:hypothetical protein